MSGPTTAAAAASTEYFTHSSLPLSLHLRHILDQDDTADPGQHLNRRGMHHPSAVLNIYVNTLPHSFHKTIVEPLQNIGPCQLFHILSNEPVKLINHGQTVITSLIIPKYGSVSISISLEKQTEKSRVGFIYDERMLLHKNEKIFIYEEVRRDREAKLQWLRHMEASHQLNPAQVGSILSLQVSADGDDDDDDDASFDPQASANPPPPHTNGGLPSQQSQPSIPQEQHATTTTTTTTTTTVHSSNPLPPPHSQYDNDDDDDGNFEQFDFENFDDDDDDDGPRSPSPDEEFHPECPQRLPAVIDMMNQEGLLQKCARINARDAAFDELTLVHSPEHVRGVREYVSSQGKVPLNYDRGDVYLNEYSSVAASLACGSVVEIADQVLQGNIDKGVAVVRSPGHHAERDRATGFCFYSNVAVAAKAMKKKHNLKRILIVDWDVHHGNGTQHAVEDDSDILFFSVHRAPPFYPGHTGFVSEIGLGDAKGYTINVPFYEPYGDAELLAAFHTVLLPVAYAFNPQLVLISAGFDAVKGDPIGRCHVTPSTFGVLTSMLKSLAGGKMVLALEGGYNHQQTARSFTECLRVLLGEDAKYNPMLGSPSVMCREVLHTVRRLHAPHWPQCFWDTAEVLFHPDVDEDLDEESVASHAPGEKRPRSSISPQQQDTPRKRRRADASSDLDDMSGEALTRMGEHYMRSGDYETAYLIFEKAKDKDNLDALFHLAELQYSGKGVDKNLREARILYETGAHLDHAGCKVALAAMYAQGEIPINGGNAESGFKKAVKWYESAAFEDNHPVAFRNLGYCYKNGVGVEQDLHKALKFFLKASDLGNTQAMVSVGCMYVEGQGVDKKNYEAGKRYFQMAADNDDSDGWYNVGLCHEYGYGCEQNMCEAMQCYNRAIELNHEHTAAREKVERLVSADDTR